MENKLTLTKSFFYALGLQLAQGEPLFIKKTNKENFEQGWTFLGTASKPKWLQTEISDIFRWSLKRQRQHFKDLQTLTNTVKDRIHEVATRKRPGKSEIIKKCPGNSHSL